jgi:hypothetical protein
MDNEKNSVKAKSINNSIISKSTVESPKIIIKSDVDSVNNKSIQSKNKNNDLSSTINSSSNTNGLKKVTNKISTNKLLSSKPNKPKKSVTWKTNEIVIIESYKKYNVITLNDSTPTFKKEETTCKCLIF